MLTSSDVPSFTATWNIPDNALPSGMAGDARSMEEMYNAYINGHRAREDE